LLARGVAAAADLDVSASSAAARSEVKPFIGRFRDEILDRWKAAARSIPAARPLPAVTLLDHMPQLLDQIAEVAETIVAQAPPEEAFATAQRHAIDRLEEGFDIAAVVVEMSLLRGCIIDVWAREHVSSCDSELRALNTAIDRAIEVSVARYAQARERTLSGMDRISTASLESRDLDDLLGRLLAVFVETTASVDTAAILLADGDRLRASASVGFEASLRQDFSLGIGEGFAGRIARERRPLALRAAHLDPLVQSQAIRDKRVRALFGIPMIQGEQLLGVAHMGSVHAEEFSAEDRQFFASMVSRATIGIHHHLLRQQLADSERRYREIAGERERTLAKLESLLAASPVGIAFVDRDLRYLRINEALAMLNSRPVDAHVGRTVGELLPDDAAATLEPMLRGVMESGVALTNIELERPDGRTFLANYFPVRSGAGEVSGVGGIVFDVTEEKQAVEALRVEQARLQSILEHAPAAIWIKDEGGRIVLANRRLADALGHRLEDVVGHFSEELLPPEIAEQHRAHDAAVAREQRSIEVEEVVPTAAGERTFLSIKFPIPGDPPLVGGIATEITERKRMEDELRAAVRTRDDVLAIVSHDLRNPLASMQMSVATLNALAHTDHRVRRHLDVIHRASQRMDTLIDDLLDVASIRAGRLGIEVRCEQASAVVNEAVELLRPIAVEKGLTLEHRGDLQGVEVTCDRERLLQVFANLVGNAIKFCRPGDRITVTGERVDGDVRFSIADTGPGISGDMVGRLFDAYWSGPQHTRRGAGLGLYISRGIVEAHGGRIWVESAPGQGACFFFTIPRAT
jgi:PAS domain S-box-containing protein